MKSIFAILVKDVRLLLRDKMGFFFTFFFPLLFAVFFGLIFSGEGGGSRAIPVCVVDEDRSPGSEGFIGKLDKSAEFKVLRTDRKTAAEQVRQGKKTAFLVVLPGFGEAQQRTFWGEPPKAELGVDPSRKAEAGLIEGVIVKYASERFQELFSDPGRMSQNVRDNLSAVRNSKTIPPKDKIRLGRFLGELDRFLIADTAPNPVLQDSLKGRFQPLDIRRVDVGVARIGPKNAFEFTFPQGIVWGLLACTAGFGISLITERSSGTLLRLRSSPVRRWQILAGKSSACFCTALSVSVLLSSIAVVGFRVRPHSPGLLALSLFSASIAFTGIMMLMSVLGKTEQSGAGIGWAFNLVIAMIGGGMIPLFIMPPWMRSVSNLSPVKWAILGMEGAMWRGFSFREMLLPCAILLGIGIVFFAVGVRLFRWGQE